jgi:hypothetical protein
MKHDNPVVTFKITAPMMYGSQRYVPEGAAWTPAWPWKKSDDQPVLTTIELHGVLEAPLIETLLASETIAPIEGESA